MSLYTDVEDIRDKVKAAKTRSLLGNPNPIVNDLMMQLGMLLSEIQDRLDEVLNKHKDSD